MPQGGGTQAKLDNHLPGVLRVLEPRYLRDVTRATTCRRMREWRQELFSVATL